MSALQAAVKASLGLILKINDGTSFQTVKAVVSRSAGQPTSPVDGQLHYDTTASNFLMYDADAAAWVTL